MTLFMVCHNVFCELNRQRARAKERGGRGSVSILPPRPRAPLDRHGLRCGLPALALADLVCAAVADAHWR